MKTISNVLDTDGRAVVTMDWDALTNLWASGNTHLMELPSLKTNQSPFEVDEAGCYRTVYKKKKYYYIFHQDESKPDLEKLLIEINKEMDEHEGYARRMGGNYEDVFDSMRSYFNNCCNTEDEIIDRYVSEFSEAKENNYAFPFVVCIDCIVNWEK